MLLEVNIIYPCHNLQFGNVPGFSTESEKNIRYRVNQKNANCNFKKIILKMRVSKGVEGAGVAFF